MLLNAVQRHAQEKPEHPAVILGGDTLTYRELWEKSMQIAQWLSVQGEGPVLVYGHKHPNMIDSLLACLLSGRPWVPCDCSTPCSRIHDLKNLCESDLVLLTDPVSAADCVSAAEPVPATETGSVFPFNGILMEDIPTIHSSLPPCSSDQIAYIMYTSGTTGTPKGIPITLKNVEAFAGWLLSHKELASSGEGVVINQANLSFDLSVADWCTALILGGTLLLTTREEQFQLAPFFEQIRIHHGSLLICTPTFLRLCLCDCSFSQTHLPSLNAIFLCGEVLTPSAAQLVKQRFPNLFLFNAYGPTESTCAVCGLEITEELLQADPLPVGILSDAAVQITLEDGEICLNGPSLFGGYLKQPSIKPPYRTGDLGRIEGDHLYCLGRRDSQIKYMGYRMDIEEIRRKIEALPEIQQAVVVAQRSREGAVTRLVAYTQPPCQASEVRWKLEQELPSYMIPSRWLPLEQLPVSSNTKTKVR